MGAVSTALMPGREFHDPDAKSLALDIRARLNVGQKGPVTTRAEGHHTQTVEVRDVARFRFAPDGRNRVDDPPIIGESRLGLRVDQ